MHYVCCSILGCPYYVLLHATVYLNKIIKNGKLHRNSIFIFEKDLQIKKTIFELYFKFLNASEKLNLNLPFYKWLYKN